MNRNGFILGLVIFCNLLIFDLQAEDSCILGYNSDDNVLKLVGFLDFVGNLLQEAKTVRTSSQFQESSGQIDTADQRSVTCPKYPVDCEELLQCGYNKSGIYKVWPRNRLSTGSLNVYCDMTTDGGGWTVFQRRGNFGRPKDYFYNDWNVYKRGFGDLRQEFWLGNDFLFALTNQRLYSLRIDLRSIEGESRYAVYDNFWIDSEQYNYYLHVRGYTGDAGNSFSSHDGKAFSTHDRDNDQSDTNCAARYRGGWWYAACHEANLNGLYLNGNHSSFADGVEWKAWKGYHYSFPFVEMKIRSFQYFIQRQNQSRVTTDGSQSG